MRAYIVALALEQRPDPQLQEAAVMEWFVVIGTMLIVVGVYIVIRASEEQP